MFRKKTEYLLDEKHEILKIELSKYQELIETVSSIKSSLEEPENQDNCDFLPTEKIEVSITVHSRKCIYLNSYSLRVEKHTLVVDRLSKDMHTIDILLEELGSKKRDCEDRLKRHLDSILGNRY